MYTELDIQSWPRKDQYNFFKDFDIPFFNICADIDVTSLVQMSKLKKVSFFIASLYASTRAVNEVEAFRYRIKDDKVIVYDVIHAGSTVLYKDETFGFCYFPWDPDYKTFSEQSLKILQEFTGKKETLNPRVEQDDLIHYSIVPWIRFTSISHARKFRSGDSIPKIVFGKYFQQEGVWKMPVSVEVHHALLDALHVAKYFDVFQETICNFSSMVKSSV